MRELASGVEVLRVWRVELPLLDRDGAPHVHPMLSEHGPEAVDGTDNQQHTTNVAGVYSCK